MAQSSAELIGHLYELLAELDAEKTDIVDKYENRLPEIEVLVTQTSKAISLLEAQFDPQDPAPEPAEEPEPQPESEE